VHAQRGPVADGRQEQPPASHIGKQMNGLAMEQRAPASVKSSQMVTTSTVTSS
jgi:hypothetical protein